LIPISTVQRRKERRKKENDKPKEVWFPYEKRGQFRTIHAVQNFAKS